MFLKDFVPDSLDDFVINRELTDYLKRNKGISKYYYLRCYGGERKIYYCK